MPQKFERVVQQDLNVGTGTLWLKAPGSGEILSTQLGLHSVARGRRVYGSTWAPGAIAAGGKVSTTVTIPAAIVGDFVLVSHDKVLTSALRVSGHINAVDTVRVVIQNPTSAAVTVASGTLSVLVFPSRIGVTAFTLVSGLSLDVATNLLSADMLLSAGGYDSFGISESADGPFTASILPGCPAGIRTVYVEGRSGGGFPLVLSGTVEITDALGTCP